MRLQKTRSCVRSPVRSAVANAIDSVLLSAPFTNNTLLNKGQDEFTPPSIGDTNGNRLRWDSLNSRWEAVKAEEVRFDSRRVENLAPHSEDLTSALWTVADVTANSAETATTLELTGVGNSFYYKKATPSGNTTGRNFLLSADVTAISGVTTVGISSFIGATVSSQAIDLSDGTTKRVVLALTPAIDGDIAFGIDNRTAAVSGVDTGATKVTFTNIQIEESTGKLDTTTPSELVSSTHNSSNALGVQYFDYENSNTVTSNIVTDSGDRILIGRNLIANSGLKGDGTVIGEGSAFPSADLWTAAVGSVSVDNGRLLVTNTSAAPSRIRSTIATVIGQTYTVWVNHESGTVTGVAYIGTTAGGSDLVSSPALGTGITKYTFTATGTTTHIQLLTNGAVDTQYTYWNGIYIGTPINGMFVEGAATNLFLNSTAAATQDITLSTGNHTLSVHGSGTVTSSDNSATSTGHGAASDGTDITFNVTSGGTVTFTVSGSPDYVQVETGTYSTSPIETAGSSVTRLSDEDGTIQEENLNNNQWSLEHNATFDYPSTARSGTINLITKGANPFLTYDFDNTRFEITDGTNTATVTKTFTAGESISLKAIASSVEDVLRLSINGIAGTATNYDDAVPAGDFTFKAANHKYFITHRSSKGADWLEQ